MSKPNKSVKFKAGVRLVHIGKEHNSADKNLVFGMTHTPVHAVTITIQILQNWYDMLMLVIAGVYQGPESVCHSISYISIKCIQVHTNEIQCKNRLIF